MSLPYILLPNPSDKKAKDGGTVVCQFLALSYYLFFRLRNYVVIIFLTKNCKACRRMQMLFYNGGQIVLLIVVAENDLTKNRQGPGIKLPDPCA